MKKFLQISLLIIVVAGVSYAVMQNRKDGSVTEEQVLTAESAETVTEEVPALQPNVVVTYFTTDVRCKSCRAIETQTREVIEGQFADALAAGSLVFQTKNIDHVENKHYIDEYQLSFKTVVISTMEEGREVHFSKMDKVWELLNDPDAFANYIAQGIEASQSHQS